eukprot:1284189-Rhodomonas_salina.2
MISSSVLLLLPPSFHALLPTLIFERRRRCPSGSSCLPSELDFAIVRRGLHGQERRIPGAGVYIRGIRGHPIPILTIPSSIPSCRPPWPPSQSAIETASCRAGWHRENVPGRRQDQMCQDYRPRMPVIG